jgi:alkaline phosphatase D
MVGVVRVGSEAARHWKGTPMNRRQFLRGATLLGGSLATPALSGRPLRAQTPERARPPMPYGVQSGDVTAERAVIWSATDRPARMIVEWATTEHFSNPRRVVGPVALPETGHSAKAILTGLPGGQDIFYRVSFVDLGDLTTASPPSPDA